jgi:hypothetical protein
MGVILFGSLPEEIHGPIFYYLNEIIMATKDQRYTVEIFMVNHQKR